MWTAKTLVRLGRCLGWSESSLGTQVMLLVLFCGSSFESVRKCLYCYCFLYCVWWQLIWFIPFSSAPDYSKYADTEEPVGPQSHQSKSFKFLQDTLDRGQGMLDTVKIIRRLFGPLWTKDFSFFLRMIFSLLMLRMCYLYQSMAHFVPLSWCYYFSAISCCGWDMEFDCIRSWSLPFYVYVSPGWFCSLLLVMQYNRVQLYVRNRAFIINRVLLFQMQHCSWMV